MNRPILHALIAALLAVLGGGAAGCASGANPAPQADPSPAAPADAPVRDADAGIEPGDGARAEAGAPADGDSTVVAVAGRPPAARGAADSARRPATEPITDVAAAPAPLTHLEVEAPQRMLAGTRAVLGAAAFTATGRREIRPPFTWRSNDETVLRVSAGGVATALAPGAARVEVSAEGVSAGREIRVVPNPARRVEVAPAEAAVRAGEVVHLSARVLDANGEPVDDVSVEWAAAAVRERTASARIDPDGTFVANSPGTYRVTATFGSLADASEIRASPRLVRQPLILLGHGTLPSGAAANALRVFEGMGGRDYAYVGTQSTGMLYVWDVTDPSSPRLTDSVRVAGRRVSDIAVGDDATFAAVAGEQAPEEVSGLTLLDIRDPAHPVSHSESTMRIIDGLPGGVGDVWIEGGLVSAVSEVTGDLHILDVSDPSAPRQVGRWEVASGESALGEITLKDGFAYVGAGNDGLVILDVGAGINGGTPADPRFVADYTYSYPLGAETYGNAHQAVRYRNWVFVADEIFGCAQCLNGSRGFVHVIDVADIENPVEVAFYRVPEAGTHDLWADDERLYVAYGQAGVRVVDISGELRGNLWRQGREIGWFMTGTADGPVPNVTRSWEVQPHKEALFVSDVNSGLWMLRLGSGGREPLP